SVSAAEDHLLTLDLHPDTGESRQHVVAPSSDRDLGYGFGEQRAVDRAGSLGEVRKLGVLVNGQSLEREPGAPAGNDRLCPLDGQFDWLVGQCASDVGQHLARDEDRPLVGYLSVNGYPP